MTAQTNTTAGTKIPARTAQRVLFLITAIALIAFAGLPAVSARDAFIYNEETNTFGVYHPSSAVSGGLNRYTSVYNSVYPTSSAYYARDRYGEQYVVRVNTPYGSYHSHGVNTPAPYDWRCVGSGCARTPYLAALHSGSYRGNELRPGSVVFYKRSFSASSYALPAWAWGAQQYS
jgi:hypothetical protein